MFKYVGTQQILDHITSVVPIRGSIIVTFGKKLIVEAPFHLDRPFGGIHYYLFECRNIIIAASPMLGENTLFNELLIEKIQMQQRNSPFVILLDASNIVTIIDLERGISNSLSSLNLTSPVVNICGSETIPFQFVCLTEREIILFLISHKNIDTLLVLKDKFFSCNFFSGQYIFRDKNNLFVIENQQLSTLHSFDHQLIDAKFSKHSFCALMSTDRGLIFEVPGVWSKQIKSMKNVIWGFDTPFVSFLDSKMQIIVFNIETDQFICKKLPELTDVNFQSLILYLEGNCLKVLIHEAKSLTLLEMQM